MSPARAASPCALLAAIASLIVAGCSTSTPSEGDGHAVGEGGPDGALDGSDRPDREDSGNDARLDADGPAGGGPLTFTFRSIEALVDRLCDLDGDGQEDNAIADLGTPASQLFLMVLNQGMDGNIEDGNRSGLHFPWVDDLSGPTDSDAFLMLMGIVDADIPDDPTDDFDGDDRVFADADYLLACGAPAFPVDGVRLGGGRVSSETFNLGLPVNELALVLEGGRADGSIEPWGASMELNVCGYASIAEAGALPGFTGTEKSVLEEFLAGGAAFGVASLPGLSPDVDVDGDGLERFVVDGDGNVVSCIDGDNTPIGGSDCWSDPRMADGFSLNVRLEGVATHFAGREPAWASRFPPEEACTEPSPDDELLASPAHDEGACADLDAPCDPLKSDGACCEPEQVCAGTYHGVYRCSASCPPTRCATGGLPGMCRPTDEPSGAVGYCMLIAGYMGRYDCSPGAVGCRPGDTVCVAVDAGGWTSCFPSCTPEPSGCDDSTHVCVPQVFDVDGACVLRERFEEPPP